MDHDGLQWTGDENRPEPTDAERIAQLEAEVRRLNKEVRDLGKLARSVATMEKKWADKERNDRSLSARMRRF